MLNPSSLLVRRAINSFVRHGSHGGQPGENLPFSLTNRFRLTAWFIVFFGSGLAAPFIVLRHQLLKK
ncbi:cytochrome c oxidase subunit 7C, mitochondrial-like [Onthophagus taurus]|uniref:cytochrome c oxidase subunit 7C, mitochondrial-like n=1 Tax=Onthophagus taurus TaxID=166361 RepID=UPI000C20692D|nr:cytochrome c oxidase subunit 7C, mitochondrial-like [Onthophagus taurus]